MLIFLTALAHPLATVPNGVTSLLDMSGPVKLTFVFALVADALVLLQYTFLT